jgi:uncharacterized protein
MKINVLTELRQPVGSVSALDLSGSLSVDDLQIEALEGTARLIRTNRGLLVRVEATGSTPETCSRCLNPTKTAIPIQFEEEYVPIFDPLAGERVRSEVEADTFRITDNFELDLGEGIRQYLLLAEPIQPLCRQDCAGLCAECGADLNDSACNCAARSDSQWQELAGMKTE